MTRIRRTAPLLGLLLLLGASTADPSGPRPVSVTDLQVSAIGDSITEADSDDFDQGDIGQGSWATYANGGGVRIVGGWAHAGATTEDMLAGVVDGVASGVMQRRPLLVLMGGSNDIDAGVPIPTILHNLSEIPKAAGAERVTLSAVPPEAPVQATVDALNAQLLALAQREGWQFEDPMVDVRDADGNWLPGMSDDGVHPTQRAAELIGERLGAALNR